MSEQRQLEMFGETPRRSMELSATVADLADILPWRDLYRREMACQIVHDSIHVRPGWAHEYTLHVGRSAVGYGSVVVAGPWEGKPTVYEFYVSPPHRVHAVELFRELLTSSQAVMINVQTNDILSTVMLHAFAKDVTNEAMVFHDRLTTALSPEGATFRSAAAGDIADVADDDLRWHGVVEVEGTVAATGGILFHYNPPYGDIYMEVAEPFRRRGLASFLVQELKRVCYEGGRIPVARCHPDNIASRRALQKAGFAPCANILTGVVERRPDL